MRHCTRHLSGPGVEIGARAHHLSKDLLATSPRVEREGLLYRSAISGGEGQWPIYGMSNNQDVKKDGVKR